MDYDSILILGEGQKDGILVDTQGYSYARYAALVPFARLLVDEHMKELTDYVIGKVKSGEGNIQKILMIAVAMIPNVIIFFLYFILLPLCLTG